MYGRWSEVRTNVGLVYMWMYVVSRINIYKGMQEHTCGYHSFHTSKYWYLMCTSRWENICIHKLLFESMIQFQTILILGQLQVGLKVLTWHKPKWYWKQEYRQIPIPYWHQIMWNPHYRHLSGIKNRCYQSNNG